MCIRELSKINLQPLDFARLFSEPIRRTSVFLLLSLRKLLEKPSFNFGQTDRQTVREKEQRKNRSRLRGQVELGVISITAIVNAKFSEDASKRK